MEIEPTPEVLASLNNSFYYCNLQKKIFFVYSHEYLKLEFIRTIYILKGHIQLETLIMVI